MPSVIYARNLKYTAYLLDEFLEFNLWKVSSFYEHPKRRFNLLLGCFGVRCETPLILYVSHAHATWKNASIYVHLRLGNKLITSYKTQPNDFIPDAFLDSLMHRLEDIRDNPEHYETLNKQQQKIRS